MSRFLPRAIWLLEDETLDKRNCLCKHCRDENHFVDNYGRDDSILTRLFEEDIKSIKVKDEKETTKFMEQDLIAKEEFQDFSPIPNNFDPLAKNSTFTSNSKAKGKSSTSHDTISLVTDDEEEEEEDDDDEVQRVPPNNCNVKKFGERSFDYNVKGYFQSDKFSNQEQSLNNNTINHQQKHDIKRKQTEEEKNMSKKSQIFESIPINSLNV